MKPVEETFSSAAFRRVILPGIILTMGFHPVLSTWLVRVGSVYDISSTVFLVAEVIFFGLIVSSSIQWIYYVYEGFRLPQLTALVGCINRRRVAGLQEQLRSSQQGRNFDDLSEDEKDRVTRIYEDISDFPLRRADTGAIEHYAERPTRLGNIVATYELYAETRYGVDGIYYWYHLLNLAPDSARKHFEEQYAFAESLVLT